MLFIYFFWYFYDDLRYGHDCSNDFDQFTGEVVLVHGFGFWLGKLLVLNESSVVWDIVLR
jgi:hypothetical protein